MAELIKPCPICGCDGIDTYNVAYGYVVYCENTDCIMNQNEVGFETVEQAIKEWNKRPTEADIRAKAIDEFAEKLGILCENSAMALDRYNGRPLYNKDGKWHDLINDVAEQLKGE